MKLKFWIPLIVTLCYYCKECTSETQKLNEIVAKPHQFPYVGKINIKNDTDITTASCIGTAISRKHVLTSAACLKDNGNDSILNFVFENPKGKDKMVFITSEVSKVEYDTANNESGVAIVTLNTLLPEDMTLACLHTRIDEKFEGKKLMAVGFPSGKDFDSLPKVVKYENMEVISNEECAKDQNVTDKMICVYEPEIECFVDRGGPLITIINKRPTLVGVMEMGKEEECQVKLIVYQRVADQDKWLVETTDVEKCPTDPEPEPEREKSSSAQHITVANWFSLMLLIGKLLAPNA